MGVGVGVGSDAGITVGVGVGDGVGVGRIGAGLSTGRTDGVGRTEGGSSSADRVATSTTTTITTLTITHSRRGEPAGGRLRALEDDVVDKSGSMRPFYTGKLGTDAKPKACRAARLGSAKRVAWARRQEHSTFNCLLAPSKDTMRGRDIACRPSGRPCRRHEIPEGSAWAQSPALRKCCLRIQEWSAGLLPRNGDHLIAPIRV